MRDFLVGHFRRSPISQLTVGGGSASTYGCKVNVIASPTGVITQLNAEDYSPGGSGLKVSREPLELTATCAFNASA
jgi:hypothetical protein